MASVHSKKCKNPNCNVEFEPRGTRKVYCSRRCQARDFCYHYNKRDRLANPKTWIYHRAKQNAEIRGLEFNLTMKDIPDIPEFCPVFPWIPLESRTGKGRKGRHSNSPSLDRIDSSRGYVPGNIRIISLRANVLKSDGTPQEFGALIQDWKKYTFK
jgi:hypothetical protein